MELWDRMLIIAGIALALAAIGTLLYVNEQRRRKKTHGDLWSIHKTGTDGGIGALLMLVSYPIFIVCLLVAGFSFAAGGPS